MRHIHLVICLFFGASRLVFAHPGGLDAHGCHTVRATGEYHCHRGQAASPRRPVPSGAPPAVLDGHRPLGLLSAAPSALAPQRPPLPAPPTDPGWLDVRLLHIVDGDTIHVADMQSRRVKVRLYGIDTPERDQPGGAEATEVLRRLLSGRRLAIRVIDRHRKREVALVSADGVSVNEALVRLGYAWTFPKYCKLSFCAAWSAAEHAASAERRGIWGLPQPAIPPWEWRHRGRRLVALP